MPKRNLDYDYSLNSKRRKKKEDVPNEEPEEPEMEETIMDFCGITDSVTVRDNDIYFYCGVNTKNIVKLITAIKDCTKRLQHTQIDLGITNLRINLHINLMSDETASKYAPLTKVKDVFGGCRGNISTFNLVSSETILSSKVSFQVAKIIAMLPNIFL